MIFVLATGFMGYLSILNRDHQAFVADQRRMVFWRDQLNDARQAGQQAPATLPIPRGDSKGVRETHIYQSLYDDVQQSRRRDTAVVYRYVPVSFFLRPAGRHVLVFDGKELRIMWIPESEIDEQAAALGMRRARPD